MKNLLVFASLLSIVSCGGGNQTASTTTTETTNADGVQVKNSRLLSDRLRNTSWAMPDYPPASVTILDGLATVSMSETSFLSNGTIAVLEDDPANNFVVFNVYTTNENRVFAVSILDPETIEVSIINNSNSLEGYKEYHDRFKVQMKKL